MTRPVTEEDFRMPEFRGAKPEHYEFRHDGKIVRKDRWEKGIYALVEVFGLNGREFEIAEVVAAAERAVGLSCDHVAEAMTRRMMETMKAWGTLPPAKDHDELEGDLYKAAEAVWKGLIHPPAEEGAPPS